MATRRSKGRSAIGTRANLKVTTIRSQNITLIAAMSRNKMWGFHLHKGGVNQNVFSEFLTKLFEDLATNSVVGAVLVMDNVAFHKTELVRSIIQNSGHQLLLLPPYSPFLNPIEEVFSQLKSIVKRSNPNNTSELLESIQKSPEEVTSVHLENFVRHSKSYFSACLQKQIINN